MIYLDVDALNAHFWSCELSYKDEDGGAIVVPESQTFVENQPLQDADKKLPYVRWTIEPGASKQELSAGPHQFKSVGMAYLEVFVPKGMGTGPCVDIVDCFIGHFRSFRSDDKCLRILETGSTKGSDKQAHQVTAKVSYQSNRT